MSVVVKFDMLLEDAPTKSAIVALLENNIPFTLEIHSAGDKDSALRLAELVNADPATMADHSRMLKDGLVVNACGSEPAFAEYREYRFMEPQRIIDWVKSLDDPISNESDIEPSKDVLPRLHESDSFETDGSAESPEELPCTGNYLIVSDGKTADISLKEVGEVFEKITERNARERKAILRHLEEHGERIE